VFAAVLPLSLLLGAAAARRVVRDPHADPEELAQRFQAMRMGGGWRLLLGLALVTFTPLVLGDASLWASPVYVLLWWCAAGSLIAAQAWVDLGAQRALRPRPGSRGRELLVRMALPVLQYSPICLGALLAIGIDALGVRADSGPASPVHAACLLAGYLLSEVVVGPLVALYGPRRPLDGPLAELFRERAGEGPVPATLLSAGGGGAPFAFAYRSWGRSRIVVTRELVDVFPADEAACVLLHELAHVRLRHVLWQEALIGVGFAAACGVLWGAGAANAATAALVYVAILGYLHPRLAQRHELVADRFAAQRFGDAAVVAAALRRLHAWAFLPAEMGKLGDHATHPELARRLAALAEGSGPDVAPDPSRMQRHGDLGWALLILAVGCAMLRAPAGAVVFLALSAWPLRAWTRARRAGLLVAPTPEADREWRWAGRSRALTVLGMAAAAVVFAGREALPPRVLAGLLLASLLLLLAGLGTSVPWMLAWTARRRADKARSSGQSPDAIGISTGADV
jgi:Zn-dependent protease with chaperone function